MSKFSTLTDLSVLLEEPQKDKSNQKLGYDGKPQRLKVRVDNKGRGGKTVTVVSGFQSNPHELKSIEKTLKTLCAAGGKILDNAIEIQGNHYEKIQKKLMDMGYVVQE